jgi:hypothetical protein
MCEYCGFRDHSNHGDQMAGVTEEPGYGPNLLDTGRLVMRGFGWTGVIRRLILCACIGMLI